jgi:hypothetical protein
MSNETQREARPIAGFSDFVPPEWINPSVYAKVIIEFYSSGLGRLSLGRELSESARNVVSAITPHPITWAFAIFSLDIPFPSMIMYSTYKDQDRYIEGRLANGVIPAGDYVVLTSPVRHGEDGQTIEGEATNALSVARGALVALAGHMAAEQLILRTSPTIDKLDHITGTAGITESYMPPDAFAFCEPQNIVELGLRMATHMHLEHRRRFATALSFIGRAAAEMDATVRFSHLWIALEVAAGGSGQIRRLFNKITQAEEVGHKLDEIKEARRQLFHEGRRYALSQDQERLICAAVMTQFFSWFGISDKKLSETILTLGASGRSGFSLGT